MTGGTFSGRAATTGAGFVLLRMLQVVQISMTVSVTLEEFEGPALVNNVATLLQIDPSRIKIVSVQSRAQVAAGGRRLQSSGLSIIFQIVEENPEPIPGEAFADSGVEPPPGVVWTITKSSSGFTSEDAENETENSTGSEASYSFSAEALEELKQLAQVLQNAADSGDLSELLQMPVILEAIDTTDPALPAAEEEEEQEEPDTDDDPAVANQPAIGEDNSFIAALIGGIVGTIIGTVMMGIFIYVKNKYYRANQIAAAPGNVDVESPQNQEIFRDLGSIPDDPRQPEP